MINVKGTIFNNLNKAFDRLRLLADNNTKLFKKILFLIVLDDLYDWSDYLSDRQSVQKKLQEMRINFITCNGLDICRFPVGKEYINVNTPQTNDTWKRVWDAPELEFVNDKDKINQFIYLTDLSQVKVIDGKNYIYSDEIPMDSEGNIRIYENRNNVNQNGYIEK